MYDVEEVLKKC